MIWSISSTSEGQFYIRKMHIVDMDDVTGVFIRAELVAKSSLSLPSSPHRTFLVKNIFSWKVQSSLPTYIRDITWKTPHEWISHANLFFTCVKNYKKNIWWHLLCLFFRSNIGDYASLICAWADKSISELFIV